MITFAEAMLITYGEMESKWDQGTLHIVSAGLEDKTHYAVMFGAREWILDKNPEFLAGDVPIAFVNKETGEFSLKAMLFEWDRLDKMTKVNLTTAQIAQFTLDLQGG